MLHKTKQYLAPFIKFAVIVACLYFLFTQWQAHPLDLETVKNLYAQLPWYAFPTMVTCSVCSWLVESKKWQVLVRGVYVLRFRESVLQNLTAQAASFITPLRAGEVFFKTLFYEKSLRAAIAGRTMVGTLAQMAVTTILGIVGFLTAYRDLLAVYLKPLWAGIAVFVVGLLLLLWIWKKYQLPSIPVTALVAVLGMSLGRYLLFAANWVLMLYFLRVPIPFWECLALIAAMYLVVSVIPVMPLVDIPVRFTAATLIFEQTTATTDIVLCATLAIWVVNTLLPTAMGCALLPFTRLKTMDS